MDELRNEEKFYEQVIQLFKNAKSSVTAAVNMTMVYSYYEAGRMIVEEEQNGKERAEYGKYILKELSVRLTEKLGKGFSYDNLKLMRKFYIEFSKDQILKIQLGKRCFPNLKTCRLQKKEENFIYHGLIILFL